MDVTLDPMKSGGGQREQRIPQYIVRVDGEFVGYLHFRTHRLMLIKPIGPIEEAEIARQAGELIGAHVGAPSTPPDPPHTEEYDIDYANDFDP